MRLAVRVKTGAHRDSLWRNGDELYVQIRADGEINEQLLKFLSGSLRVGEAAISITKGANSAHKQVKVDVPDMDLRPILNSLPDLPQVSLFDE